MAATIAGALKAHIESLGLGLAAYRDEAPEGATLPYCVITEAVATDPDGRVTEFREKPAEPVPGSINAGTYILDPGQLGAWARGENLSIERRIFPEMIATGRRVFGFSSDAYWLDLGTPEMYLRAHFDMLEGRLNGVRYPAPFVADEADVDLRAHLGRRVVVGEGAIVGPDSQVDDSVLHPGSAVGRGARVLGTILGPGARVGADATVTDSVLAESAMVPEGLSIAGARVSAGQEAISGS